MMIEIDLLPEWYKKNKRRRFGRWTQYTVLVVVFLIMLVWNFVGTISFSRASAELMRIEAKRGESENMSHKFAAVRSEMAQLQAKASRLNDIKTKIDVSNVLAELSFLVDEKIVLSKVDMKAEKFKDGKTNRGQKGSTVRTAKIKSGGSNETLFGDVRFKVIVSGVAAGATDVARLIRRLEDSPYFHHVIPLFSRNVGITGWGKTSKDSYSVSEFEISCYLANYSQKEASFAKGSVQNTNVGE